MALKPKEHFHGSDLEKIEAVYGIKKEDIISFSANVNPLGVSFRLKETLTNHIDAITTYPDREYTSLRKCIADYVHTNYKNIVVGNGSTELISLFIQITHPMKALIVGPTYSEYEREVAMGGGRSHYFSLTEASEFELDTKALTEELSANVKKTRELISSERARICARLDESPNFKVYHAHANFVLVKITTDKFTSEDAFDACIRKNLMIRDCSTFPFLNNKYIRLCFMMPEQNDALLDVLLGL